MGSFFSFFLILAVLYFVIHFVIAIFKGKFSWLISAVMGGFLGLLFLGPIGGIAGAVMGFYFGNRDSGKPNNEAFTSNRFEENFSDTPRCKFLFFLPAIMAKMVMADGKVDEREMEVVVNFYKEQGFSDNDIEIVLSAFENALENERSIYEEATNFARDMDPELNEIAYMLLWQIATADNHLDESEKIILQKITHFLGLPSHKFEEFFSHTQSDSTSEVSYLEQYKQACELLNSQMDDSLQVIKKRYRKLISEFHPDKLHSKGLPDEFLEFAKEKSQKLNQAYEIVKLYKSQQTGEMS